MNLLAPENLSGIQKDLEPYLFKSEEICKIMIDEIIEKAWVQPKYASTYAKLCNEFTKFSPLRFSFIPADER